ncbi:MAG: hypothetical protein K2M16_09760 [Muribaculaceae bacterium]|nr:hypothetical protein [Muribaculaceae bacterium]
MGLLLPIVWYIVADPFKALRHYDSYFPDPIENPVRIGLNKGMVTLVNFNDRRKEGREYDSFIFGSSISIYYDAGLWESLLEESGVDSIQTDSSHPIHAYHFDSSSETLMSMSRKLRFLDREGISVRHALIVLDPIIMGAEVPDGPAYLDPPAFHHSVLETLKYHYIFFRAATNADFFKSYIPSSCKHLPVENGRNLLFERQPIVYDKYMNQETIPQWDSLIRVDSKEFYVNHPLKESPRFLSESTPILTKERIEALESIKKIFDRHATDYHIIIGPNRSKITLNRSDLNEFRRIFRQDRVHDFSSSLAYLLETDTMLYDNTHYRPPMAEIMMRKVYESDSEHR